MSIINEALKKTEQRILENAAKNKPQGNGLASNSQSQNLPPAKFPGLKPFLFYILILLAGIYLSSFIFSLLGHKTKTAPVPNKTAIAIPRPAVLPPLPDQPIAVKEEKKAPEASFVLNGIFFSDRDGYALVNNQIVRENDSVDGAKVMKITANTVELADISENNSNVGNNQEKFITLSTRR